MSIVQAAVPRLREVVSISNSVAGVLASLPKHPPEFFYKRYVHLRFDWLPLTYTNPGGLVVLGAGFADVVTEVLKDEDPDVMNLFVRALMDAILRFNVYQFLLDTFGLPRITLRQARETAGLTISAAARVSGISEKTLRRWELDTGKAPAIRLWDLCQRVYGVSTNYIHIREADGHVE